MGLYDYMNNLGKRVEEQRQIKAKLEEKARQEHEEAVRAKQRHIHNKEQGMI